MFDRHLAFRASASPHATAMALAGEGAPPVVADVTFAMLEGAVARMAAALEGLAGCSVVAVRVEDTHAHWVATLALARLGVPTASYGAGQEATLLPLVRPDAVVADGPAPPGADRSGVRWVHASREWMVEAMSRPVQGSGPRRDVDPSAMGRLLTTSATTGEPRMVALSWARVEARVLRACQRAGAGGALARVLPILDAGGGAFVTALAALSSGGAILGGPRRADLLAAALPRLVPSRILVSPVQLRALLDAMPAGAVPLAGTEVVVGGAPLPPAVAREARLRLSPNLVAAYGTTETGTVALGHAALLGGDPGAVGWPVPGAEVSIVDEAGVPVSAGASGHVMLSGVDVTDGYFEDDAATAERFPGGGFFPGDIGSLGADGVLRIEGRIDDMMNLGGAKLMPAVLERIALSVRGVADAVAVALDGEGGTRAWLALEREADADPNALGATVKSLVARRLRDIGDVGVAWFAALPRNAGGKADRAATAARLAEARSAGGQGR